MKIKVLFLFILFGLSNMVVAQDLSLEKEGKISSDKNKKVIYKYKQYEKFDFDDIGVEGETGSPGDISVSTRYSRDFKNKLPYKLNFNQEIHRSIERIR